MSSPERELAALRRRRERSRARDEQAKAALDDGIRRHSATLTRARLAELTGLTVDRIYQILRRSR